MVSKLYKLKFEHRNKEAVTEIFREVFGHMSRYAKGLREMVILESSKDIIDEIIIELVASVERHEKDA